MKCKWAVLALFFLFLLIPASEYVAEARTETFLKEYSYQASEDDSRNSSRVIALREVKRLLLEELGTYLESQTEVRNFQLTRDQITTLTAGIVQTEIVAEKWNGSVYWLKAKIAADPEKVTQSLDDLRKDREKTRELEAMKHKSDELLRENEKLRKELAAAKDGKREPKRAAYEKSINELSSMEWLERGYAAKDLKEAAKAYTRAIELDPKSAEAYYARARISDEKVATQDYMKLLEIESKDSGSHLLRAWTYKELAKDDLALHEFGKAIESAADEKERAQAHSDRGRYYDAIKDDHSRAIHDFTKAIELNPKDSWTYIHRSQSYRSLEKTDLAFQDLNKAIAIDPQNAAAYSDRGYLVMGNHPASAIADFTKAIELYRDKSSLYYFPRAQAYEGSGKYELAVRDYSKMLELEPDTAYVYNLRARLYAELGKHDLALQDYTKTIVLRLSTNAYNDRAKYFAKYGKHGEAVKDYTMAIKLKPEFESYVDRGYSYFKLGRISLALKDYDSAIALNYQYPGKVYYYRAVLYVQEKDTAKALQELGKAIGTDPYYQGEARKDPQLDALRNHPDFVKLVGP